MFLSAALVQVIRSGSRVPGPPRAGPKNTLSPAAGGGEGFTDATSNVRLSADFAKVEAYPKTQPRAMKRTCRILRLDHRGGLSDLLRLAQAAAAAARPAIPAPLAVGAPNWSPHHCDGLWDAQAIWRITATARDSTHCSSPFRAHGPWPPASRKSAARGRASSASLKRAPASGRSAEFYFAGSSGCQSSILLPSGS